MEITTLTLGVVGLAAVGVIAIILARPRRRVTTTRFVPRSVSARPGRRGSTGWFASDPVLFVGADAGSADCGAGADGGGGCD